MFVKFKRAYFSKDAVRYEPRVWHEIADDMKADLPKDAEVSDTLPGGATEMPDKGPKAIPGFGAQPVHEQELALVGANETHLLTEATDAAPGAAQTVNVTDKKDAKTVTQSTPVDQKKVPSAKDDRSSKDPNKDL